MLCPIMSHVFSPISALFWFYFGPVSVLFQSCFGPVLLFLAVLDKTRFFLLIEADCFSEIFHHTKLFLAYLPDLNFNIKLSHIM